MFSGGDYVEVGRWLRNFVTSHAKQEHPRLEAVVEAGGPREGQSYGVRLRLSHQLRPGPEAPPVELDYAEVARERGNMAWCAGWARRVRALGRELLEAEREDLERLTSR
jgi:hypothetical protein